MFPVLVLAFRPHTPSKNKQKTKQTTVEHCSVSKYCLLIKRKQKGISKCKKIKEKKVTVVLLFLSYRPFFFDKKVFIFCFA